MTIIRSPMSPESEALAPWLSASLDDPKVCKEFKDAINNWFLSYSYDLPEVSEEMRKAEQDMWESL